VIYQCLIKTVCEVNADELRKTLKYIESDLEIAKTQQLEE